MIVGLGIDLVETRRIARALGRHGRRFAERLLTPGELALLDGRPDTVQMLAGRFAAKEAALKALGTGWSRGLGFLQVEIERGRGGAPVLRLHGAALERSRVLGVRRGHVSLTHQPGTAAAVVILEG